MKGGAAVDVPAWIPAFAVIGTVVTALVTYLLGRRAASGSVQSSEAKDLWAESSAFRAALLDRIAELQAETDRKDEVIAALRKEAGERWVQQRARGGSQ